MLQGAIRYIEQQFPKAKFSEIFYLPSVTTAADTRIEASYEQRGAIAIFLQWLYWVPSSATNNWRFNDQFNNQLFQIFVPTSGVGFCSVPMPVPLVKTGPLLRIVCPAIAGVFLSFSVCFQYLTLDNSKMQ